MKIFPRSLKYHDLYWTIVTFIERICLYTWHFFVWRFCKRRQLYERKVKSFGVFFFSLVSGYIHILANEAARPCVEGHQRGRHSGRTCSKKAPLHTSLYSPCVMILNNLHSKIDVCTPLNKCNQNLAKLLTWLKRMTEVRSYFFQ